MTNSNRCTFLNKPRGNKIILFFFSSVLYLFVLVTCQMFLKKLTSIGRPAQSFTKGCQIVF
jgi:hypothetical protein